MKYLNGQRAASLYSIIRIIRNVFFFFFFFLINGMETITPKIYLRSRMLAYACILAHVVEMSYLCYVLFYFTNGI